MHAAFDRAQWKERTAGNKLLQALKPEDLSVVAPLLQEWRGKRRTLLYRTGDDVGFVDFPCGPSLVSLVVELQDGTAVETAVVGCEGAVGNIASRGALPAHARAEVKYPGPFLRLSTADIAAFETRSPTLRNLFARYGDCMLAQVFQSVACNAAHTIEQRTVRWLLASIDRTGDHDVPLTQEQLAGMMGVGRSYVSRVIQSLKQRGVLETRRGGVRVRDPDELAGLSCGCHDALRRHFDLVLAGVYPTLDESTAQKDAAGAEHRPQKRNPLLR